MNFFEIIEFTEIFLFTLGPGLADAYISGNSFADKILADSIRYKYRFEESASGTEKKYE